MMKDGKEAKKEIIKPITEEKEKDKLEENAEDINEFPDLADSQMEDESHDPNSIIEPTIMKKKGVSHHPALMNLAGSPGKSTAIDKQRVNQSKVYIKRHSLYNDLGQIPVTVEQSTCL